MNTKDTGGPAFPVNTENTHRPGGVQHEGMTLRDYFAAKAIQGLVVNVDVINELALAKLAYKVADAMLTERDA